MATAAERFQVALEHYRLGHLAQAEQVCREILRADANIADAWHLLGFIASGVGRTEDAVSCMERVVAIEPNNADGYNNLGSFLFHLGGMERAEVCFRRAIELRPDNAGAHANLGRLYYELKRPDQAIGPFQRALELNSGAPDLHNCLGNAFADMRIADQAIRSFRTAIALKPDLAEAHNNLGSVLWTQGRLDEAGDCFRQALAIKPNFAEAYGGLGNVLNDQGRLDEAVSSYRQALALNPNLSAAASNLGNTLKQQGRLSEALACYRRAVESQPGLWRADSNLIYMLYFCPDYDAARIYAEHRRWNEQYAKPLASFIQPHLNERFVERRLRIGYVSPDFRQHAQSLFTLPLFSSHDRQQFEIFCYSGVTRPDSVTSRLQGMVDSWRDVASLNDQQVAELIRSDRIDILVDLTMHMAHGRPLIFARKPAPIQVCWLAYPGTTGMDAMDYRLTDSFLDPPGLDDRYYSETSIRLPDAFWCYDPGTTEPLVNSLPARERKQITFGSFNNFLKVNDGVLKLWANVLKAVERSSLLILADEGSHRARTQDFLEQEGVARDRIHFVSLRLRSEYLKLYHEIDITLDTFPANGHTTSLDSLWMGVPVVAAVGHTAIGRGGISILGNLGLLELIGHTPEQFVQIATELASDIDRLAEMRRTLRERLQSSPLMDAARFARNMEAAYRRMWQVWCGGGMPCLFTVGGGRSLGEVRSKAGA